MTQNITKYFYTPPPPPPYSTLNFTFKADFQNINTETPLSTSNLLTILLKLEQVHFAICCRDDADADDDDDGEELVFMYLSTFLSQ